MEEIWPLKNLTILDEIYVYMVCFMRVLQSCSYKVAKIYEARCGLFYFNLLLKESGKGIWNCKTDWKLERNIVDKEEIDKDATLYANPPSNVWLISKWPMHEREKRHQSKNNSWKPKRAEQWKKGAIIDLKIRETFKAPQAFHRCLKRTPTLGIKTIF